MARVARIPSQLKNGPFSLSDARAVGLSARALEGGQWKRLGHELYCWRDWREDPWEMLMAWSRTCQEAITFSGRSAAWMHGLDFSPFNPVEVIAPPDTTLRSAFGRDVRRCKLPPGDSIAIRGLRATSLQRTLRDLCQRWPPVEALVALDMSLHLGLIGVTSLLQYANGGGPGARRLRLLAPLAEPAESPMETRLRWLLITSGLPPPQVQTNLYGGRRELIGRADIYYPEARLAIEFDGGIHKERLVADNRRQNLIVNAGITILRFTSLDLVNRPDTVVAQVRGALAAGSHSVGLAPNPLNSMRRRVGLVPNPRKGMGGLFGG